MSRVQFGINVVSKICLKYQVNNNDNLIPRPYLHREVGMWTSCFILDCISINNIFLQSSHYITNCGMNSKEISQLWNIWKRSLTLGLFWTTFWKCKRRFVDLPLCPLWWLDLIVGVLAPLSAIFQLYHGDQF